MIEHGNKTRVPFRVRMSSLLWIWKQILKFFLEWDFDFMATIMNFLFFWNKNRSICKAKFPILSLTRLGKPIVDAETSGSSGVSIADSLLYYLIHTYVERGERRDAVRLTPIKITAVQSANCSQAVMKNVCLPKTSTFSKVEIIDGSTLSDLRVISLFYGEWR